jgi:hypothetical protein
MCRVEKEALANELNDLREMMAAEANSRAALQDALAAAERQLGEARNELDMTKTVSATCMWFANKPRSSSRTLCMSIFPWPRSGAKPAFHHLPASHTLISNPCPHPRY